VKNNPHNNFLKREGGDYKTAEGGEGKKIKGERERQFIILEKKDDKKHQS